MNASLIWILCEDILQETFIRRTLISLGFASRIIKVIPYPNGRQAGEQYVKARYPDYLKALRARTASSILIVAIDADNGEVDEHNNELDSAAHDANILPRTITEPIMHVIPRRNIETWLAYLSGESVDEATNYKHQYGFRGREREIQYLINRLIDGCNRDVSLISPPDSLQRACQEYHRRIR